MMLLYGSNFVNSVQYKEKYNKGHYMAKSKINPIKPHCKDIKRKVKYLLFEG
jgi:hypothetical protein